MLDYVRDGDVIHVYAVDRLGRDAIDVQSTIRPAGEGRNRGRSRTGADRARPG